MKLSAIAALTLWAATAFAAPSPDAAPDALLGKRDECSDYYKEYKYCKKEEYKFKKEYDQCTSARRVKEHPKIEEAT